MTPASPTPEMLEETVRLLQHARSVLFVTGAGLSADSGLPTYRGFGGLYRNQDTEDGVPIEVALSGGMLRRDPGLTWKYIHQIEAAARGAIPNRGHEVIAHLEADKPRVCVLTQNVDGLHRAAGSTNVIPIHGDIHDLRCTRCEWHERVADYAGLPPLPTCPRCASLVRPDVVLFGEMLPADSVRQLQREVSLGFDLVFTVGTTSVFPYIAEPVLSAARAGKPTVEINPGTSEVSHAVAIRLRSGAAPTLDAIWRSPK